MRDGHTQHGALLTVTTPLGADTLLLDGLEASEGVSELFQATLRLRSADDAIDAGRIVGQPVGVTIRAGDGPARHLDGIAIRFTHTGSDHGFAHYTAEVAPRLWLLTLGRDRAIHQGLSVPEIVASVLRAFGIDFRDRLQGRYPPLDYCVQFDESAFDFIARLMEAAGIFWFFSFEQGRHTLVLADAPDAHPPCDGADAIRYLPQMGERPVLDAVGALEVEDRLVLGRQVLSDFDPLRPDHALLAQAAAATPGTGRGEAFDWPGGHAGLPGAVDAGRARARVRLQAARAEGRTVRGHGAVHLFTAGTRFTLREHPRADLNTGFVLRRVHHRVHEGRYRNRFDAFFASEPFRAPLRTARPRVAGSQTATVVGPPGEEIWTDRHGRIKVRFHWDRLGAHDDTCSGWVRVAQPAAGAGFGALFIPRIGQEVVISCIDGDPDRPLVTGSVYNGRNAPPADLPAQQAQTVIRTRSTRQGTGGNEIRLDDRRDAEQFYLHAQKDLRVEVEDALDVVLRRGGETRTIEEGDRRIEVRRGAETHAVQGTRSVSVHGRESHANDGDFEHEVRGRYRLKVGGDLELEIGGDIVIRSAASVRIEAARDYTAQAGTSLTNKAGASLVNQAGAGLTNKAGTTLDNQGTVVNTKASAMQTVDGGGMLTLKGGLVKIN